MVQEVNQIHPIISKKMVRKGLIGNWTLVRNREKEGSRYSSTRAFGNYR